MYLLLFTSVTGFALLRVFMNVAERRSGAATGPPESVIQA